MSADHVKQLEAIRAVCDAVLAAVEAGGSSGASGGILYSTLMGAGVSLSVYQSIMRILCESGRIERRGECYFTVPECRYEEDSEKAKAWEGGQVA